jgi:hypothetical protein
MMRSKVPSAPGTDIYICAPILQREVGDPSANHCGWLMKMAGENAKPGETGPCAATARL